MFTITTAKGSYAAEDLRSVCKWQAEYQGAFAEINGVDVDSVDFDAEDLDAAVAAVSAALAAFAA